MQSRWAMAMWKRRAAETAGTLVVDGLAGVNEGHGVGKLPPRLAGWPCVWLTTTGERRRVGWMAVCLSVHSLVTRRRAC